MAIRLREESIVVVGKKKTHVLVMVGLGIVSVFAAAFLTILALGLPNEPDAIAQDDANGSAMYDFGDAADSYGTTLASDGARHGEAIDAGTLTLGASIDYEADAETPLDASGDDVTGTDDEDGVTIPELVAGESAAIDVEASSAGLLNAWIDWNGDGAFGLGEQIAADRAVLPGSTSISISVPANATTASTFARFRLSSQGGVGPTGAASDGEVEDYPVTVVSLVCVTKKLGPVASEAGVDAGLFEFQIDDGPSTQLGPSGCGVNEPSAAFFIAPGSAFTITEVLPEASIASAVDATCSRAPAPQDNVGRIALVIGPANLGVFNSEAGSISVAADVTDGGRIDCTFTNESVLVCVTKSYGPGAVDINLDVPLPFDATADGVLVADEVRPVVQQVEDPCFDESDDLQFGFYVAPGSEIAITELLPDGSPLSIEPLGADACTFNGQTPASPATLSGSTLTVQLPDPVTALVSEVDCELTNDVLVLCVYKYVRNTAPGVMPGDFTIDLDIEGQDTQPLVPELSSDLCDARDDAGVVGVVLPPSTIFSLTEQDPGPTTGFVNAGCDADFRAVGEPDNGLRTVTGIALLDNNETSRIRCTFTNRAVRVCVTKSLGKTADGAADSVESAEAAGLALNEGFLFDVTSGDVLIAGDQQPGLLPDACPADEGDEGFSFFLAADTEFSITETVAAGSLLRPRSFECIPITESEGGPIEGDPVASTLVGQVMTSMTADILTQLNCRLVNDVTVVCVTKSLGTNAVAVGYRADQFSFVLDGEAGGASAIGSEFCTSGDGDAGMANHVEAFAIAFDDGFTVTEATGLSPSDPIGPVAVPACQVQGVSPDAEGRSVMVASGHGSSVIQCGFVNDTVIVCVAKDLTVYAQAAADAGEFSLSDFSFQLNVDGGTDGEVVAVGASELTICGQNGDVDRIALDGAAENVVELLAKPGDQYTVAELFDETVPVDVLWNSCNGVSNTSSRVAAFAAPTGEPLNPNLFECRFVNHSVRVTVTKALDNGDGGTAVVGDFLFDAYYSEGSAIKTAMSSGDVFYVAPRKTFTVDERAVDNYIGQASCTDGAEFAQALAVGATATHTPGDDVTDVECRFNNTWVPPIPVCAMLIFEEGSTGFTLDDFSLELFKDGALIGKRSAGDPFDAACEDTTDNAASLLPGNLVQLGKVFADGSSFAFAVSIADPDELLVFEPLSCSVDAPAATQALAGPDPVTFTIDPGVSRVSCVARANEKPLIVGSGGGLPGGRPPYVEPVVAAAAAAPAPEAAQVVAVAVAAPAPIAVTGSSTTGVTLPVAFGLLSAGFVGLGLDRRRRNANQLG